MICWRKQVLIPFNLLLLYVLFRTSTSQLLFCTYNYFTVHIFTMRDTTYKLTVENNLLGTILQTLLSNLTIISDHATYIPFHETQQKNQKKKDGKQILIISCSNATVLAVHGYERDMSMVEYMFYGIFCSIFYYFTLLYRCFSLHLLSLFYNTEILVTSSLRVMSPSMW